MHNISGLLALLEEERQLILAGDLHAIPELADAKAILISQLKRNALSQGQLSQLQTITARNQNLLSAAANGIRAAQKRLDAIRNPAHGVKTYTRTGVSQLLSRTPSSFEKRA